MNSALILWGGQDGRSPSRYAYTETTGFRYRLLVRKSYLFPYTPPDLDPPSSKFGLDHPQTAGIRKTVPFRIPASPAAIRSAFLIEADQTLTAAVCPKMTHSSHSSATHPLDGATIFVRFRNFSGERRWHESSISTTSGSGRPLGTQVRLTSDAS